ncbi:MAG TPA: hypothetical protein VKR22_00130, partial [Acidimicrobiales bacterium]|nr:hypothetical protein [Acidimicrobiales bacterium]
AARAELSSLATALAEITRRVAGIAEEAAAHKDDVVSSELFAVERALRGAGRRLERLTTRR